MRVLVLIFVGAALAYPQVTAVPNSDFPTFRTNLNSSLANAASVTGSYSNPTWITALAYAKITGVPSFESPLTFSSPLSRTSNTISIVTNPSFSGNGTFSGTVTATSFLSPPGTIFLAKGVHIAASSVATPASGESVIFFNLSNSDKLSRKDSTDTVTVVEGGGGGSSPGGSTGQYQFNNAGSLAGQAMGFGGGSVLTSKQQVPEFANVTLTQGGNLTLPAQTTPYSVTLATNVSCNTWFSGSVISITTAFSGGSAGLWGQFFHGSVAIGPQIDLTQTAGTFAPDVPGMGCVGSGTNDLKFTFTSSGSANLSLYTAGAVKAKIMGSATE